jgi:hypothetical protein
MSDAPRPVQILWNTEGVGQTFHLTLDATVKETHELSAQVTDHPVESGSNLTDHIRTLPARISLQGIISNTPIVVPVDGADSARGIQVLVEGAQPTILVPFGGRVPLGLPRQQASVLGFDRQFDRVLVARQQLELINQRGILVSIVTTFKTYYSMAFESISFDRDKDTGNAVSVQLSAKEVLIGQVTSASVPAIATSKKDTGHKPAAPVEKEKASNRTMLHTMFGDEADGASIEEDL